MIILNITNLTFKDFNDQSKTYIVYVPNGKASPFKKGLCLSLSSKQKVVAVLDKINRVTKVISLYNAHYI